jgi:hypothetical protein
VAAASRSFSGFVFSTTGAYFAIIQDDPTDKNFQSYYLTVDRCVTRDGSNVCTLCLPGVGYYRMGTAPNNLCQTTAEFPAAWGIDTGASFLASPCTDANCNACATNYLICTACNTVGGWYLDGTSCEHATLSPQIPSGKGANTVSGLVVNCQDTNCLLCKASYSVCIGCNTGSGWYLDGLVCKHAVSAPQIPSGKGPNTGTGLVVSCQDTHCLLCKSDYTICTGCDTGSSWYLDGSTCKHPVSAPQIASGKGANTVAGTVVNCQDTHCLLCKSDYSICTGCDTGSSWYLDGTTCKHPVSAPQIASGKGANTVAGTVVNCQDTHCLLCKVTYLTCTGCDTGSSWYLDGSTCKHPVSAPQIPSAKGANTVTGAVVNCQDTHCLLCKPDYSICTGCDTGNSWYLDGTTCEHPVSAPQIPSAKGANTVAGTVVSCQDIHCLLCKVTYMTCTGCDMANSWYLDGSTCKHPTLSPQIPNNFGANIGTGLVVPCQDPMCSLCKSDYTTCTGCDLANNWFMDITICKHPTLSPIIPNGKGGNTVTGQVELCQDSNCLLCAANYAVCTQCNTVSSWYLDGTGCKHPSLAPQIPVSKGANTVTGTVVPCQDTHCLLCKVDYTVCTGCDTGSSWYLDGTTCKHPVSAPQIASGKGANTVTGAVVNCQDSNCLLCKADYSVCISCNTGSGWYLDGLVCMHAVSAPQIPSGKGPNTGTGLVVNCQDSHCLLCKSDYTICTGCDTGSSWYLDATTCKHPVSAPQIASGKGANTVTGTVVNCQDTNCLLCKATYDTCTGCNTVLGWYLNGVSCQHATLTPTIPDFFGANTGTGNVVSCQVNHCKICKADYSVCTGCDTVSGWYLNGNVCQNAASFPVGMGPNLVNGMVQTCTEPFCMKCSNSKLTCQGCQAALDYFLNPNTTTCDPKSSIPDDFGPNVIPGTIEACHDPGCVKCKDDYMICTECRLATGYFLFGTGCIGMDNIPQGYGIDNQNYIIEKCTAGLGCLNCKMDYLKCISCDSAQKMFLNNSKCIGPKDFAPGFGVDINANKITSCLDTNCVRCVDNYQICTECDQANGYILVNGSCAMPVMLQIAQSTSKLDSVDLSFSLTPDKSEISDNLLTALEKLISVEVNFTDTATNQVENVQFKQTLKAATGQMTYTIKISSSLVGKEYGVMVGSSQRLMKVENGTKWLIRLQATRVVYQNAVTAKELAAAASQAAPVSSLSSVSSGDSAASMSLMGTLMAADPTGTFFRFTKILQIVNKLYFININYGKRLEAFLARSIGEVDDPTPEKPQKVFNRRTTRGKLSLKEIPMDFVYIAGWKQWVYLGMWAMNLFKRFLLDNCIMGKVGIYFCHYANKVHLIIFNLVFIDFIWLAPRTLMHSRGLSNFKVYTPALILFLLAADLCLILAHLLDDRIWRKALEHYTNLRPYLKKGFVPPPLPDQTQVGMVSDITSDDNNDSKSKKAESEADEKNKSQTKQINYKRTYFEIDFNVHLMDLVVARMRITDEAFNSTMGRMLLLNLWLKVPLLQLVVLGCQYCSFVAITTLFVYDAAFTVASIYAYLKYKYLKNIICLLMEIISSASFILFYIIAFAVSQKRFDEIILDFYQDAGIWIVIASCVAEYLLLLTYIGVAAYDFFKNRKMMKKMNLKSKYSLIHYLDEAELIREAAIAKMLASLNDAARRNLNASKDNIVLNKNPVKKKKEIKNYLNADLIMKKKLLKDSLKGNIKKEEILNPSDSLQKGLKPSLPLKTSLNDSKKSKGLNKKPRQLGKVSSRKCVQLSEIDSQSVANSEETKVALSNQSHSAKITGGNISKGTIIGFSTNLNVIECYQKSKIIDGTNLNNQNSTLTSPLSLNIKKEKESILNIHHTKIGLNVNSSEKEPNKFKTRRADHGDFKKLVRGFDLTIGMPAANLPVNTAGLKSGSPLPLQTRKISGEASGVRPVLGRSPKTRKP